MKKLFVIGFIALFMLSACDPIEHETKYVARWYVKNTSDVSLKICHPKMVRYTPVYSVEPKIIEPGDSILIYGATRTWADNEIPLFEEFHEVKEVTLYDIEDNVLQEWCVNNALVDEYSIFNEQNWSFRQLYYPEYLEYYSFNNIESMLGWVYEVNYNNTH